MRAAAQLVMVLVGVLCLVMFFSYELQYTDKLVDPPIEIRRTTLGLSDSPWFERVETRQAGKFTETTNIQVDSWSWILLLIALVCLRKAWGMRRGSTEPLKESTP